MAKTNQDGLANVASKDAELGWVFGEFYPAAVEYKKTNGGTITYAAAPEPPADMVPTKLVNELTGERGPVVDSKGEPISPARLVLNKVKARYKPSATNKRSNPALFGKIRAMILAVNKASGITRGRGGAEMLDEADVEMVVEGMDENAI